MGAKSLRLVEDAEVRGFSSRETIFQHRHFRPLERGGTDVRRFLRGRRRPGFCGIFAALGPAWRSCVPRSNGYGDEHFKYLHQDPLPAQHD